MVTVDLAERELAEELVARRGEPDTPFGLYAVWSEDPAADLGRAVERDVFFEAFGNTPDLLAQEYDVYEPASLFLIAVDHNRLLPAGVLRLITATPIGLKTLHDIERVWGESLDDVLERSGVTFHPERVWDGATMAVRREYRASATDGIISASFLQSVPQLGHVFPIDYVLATVDVVVLKLIQDMCARPMHAFKGVEPIRYLDSPLSVPAYFDIAEYTERVRPDPSLYEMWIEGKGFEAAISTPDWAELARVTRPQVPQAADH